jgi:hypothetical protein
METTINRGRFQIDGPTTQTNNHNLWNRILAIADEQAGNLTGWFLFSLVFQGVFFLPIPIRFMLGYFIFCTLVNVLMLAIYML